MIVRDLDDEQMLKFMGRENLEDYNADFLTMLETWEAAAGFAPSSDVINPQPIEITRLLRWLETWEAASTLESPDSETKQPLEIAKLLGWVMNPSAKPLRLQGIDQTVHRHRWCLS